MLTAITSTAKQSYDEWPGTKYVTTTEGEGVLIQTVTTAIPINGTTVFGGEPMIDRTINTQSNNNQTKTRFTFRMVDLKNT